MKDHNKLLEICKAATEGPWRLDEDDVGIDFDNFIPIHSDSHLALAQVVWKMEDEERSPNREATAKYIATFSPDKVMELLERVEALEAENSEMLKFAEDMLYSLGGTDQWEGIQWSNIRAMISEGRKMLNNIGDAQ